MEHDTTRFKELSSQIAHLRAAYYAGANVYDEMQRLALEATEIYNQTALVIAKRFKRKPKLVTVTSMIRDARA